MQGVNRGSVSYGVSVLSGRQLFPPWPDGESMLDFGYSPRMQRPAKDDLHFAELPTILSLSYPFMKETVKDLLPAVLMDWTRAARLKGSKSEFISGVPA